MVVEKNIPVLDCFNVFISYTNPAKARILIKKDKAIVFNKDPFILKLKGESDDEMLKKSSTDQGMFGNSITNFTKYFAQEREVYVQNMGSTPSSTCMRHRVIGP